MADCARCGEQGITRAHVKDKSECLKEGITDHEYRNIVELCYNCHYVLFDKRKMGIKKRGDKYFFIFLDNSGEVIEVESKHSLNIDEDYIKWKNKRCLPKLLRCLFSN